MKTQRGVTVCADAVFYDFVINKRFLKKYGTWSYLWSISRAHVIPGVKSVPCLNLDDDVCTVLWKQSVNTSD